MNQREIAQVVKIAATHVLASVREQVTDIVRHNLPVVIKPEPEQQVSKPWPRRSDVYVMLPKPLSNYTQALIASAKWRIGRGECLGSVWMFKPSTQEKLLVEQYGQECSVMRMDKAQPRAKFDTANLMTAPGKSIWTDFYPVKGVIEDVVAKQKAKGWEVFQPEPEQPLSLVDRAPA